MIVLTLALAWRWIEPLTGSVEVTVTVLVIGPLKRLVSTEARTGALLRGLGAEGGRRPEGDRAEAGGELDGSLHGSLTLLGSSSRLLGIGRMLGCGAGRSKPANSGAPGSLSSSLTTDRGFGSRGRGA